MSFKGGSFKQDSSFNRRKSVNAKAMDAMTGSSSFKQGGSFKDRSYKPTKPSPADCKPDPEGPLAHDPIECMRRVGSKREQPLSTTRSRVCACLEMHTRTHNADRSSSSQGKTT